MHDAKSCSASSPHDVRNQPEHATSADTVIAHYDSLANRYDPERFETTYGRYVNAQERRLLRRWLPTCESGPILDLGCGTGRLLEFATHGLDGSPNMAAIARQKHPGKPVQVGRMEQLDELAVRFRAISCMHVFMHLTPETMAEIGNRCWTHLEPGGVFVFDVPSRPRRELTGFRPENWHANNAMSFADLKTMLAEKWRITAWRGILFLPVHRLPRGLRLMLRPLDDLISATPLKRWASYWIFRVERKP
jgi:SAM-dependent methyltransferase